MCPHQPLGSLHRALRKGDIRLNGAKTAPETRVQQGDTVAIWEALLEPAPKTSPGIQGIPPEWILFEGKDLVAVNKPSGLLVHRGDGSGPSDQGLLDERVRAWLAPTASTSLGFRPGPLHRLDRETSGIVVFSRTLTGARTFSAALASQQVKKTYLAVLRGDLPGPREVTDSLTRDQRSKTSSLSDAGEKAVSRFRPLAHAGTMTLVEVDLGTGRTHQIRVHAQSLGVPLAGDKKYGGGPTPLGMDVPWLLHAWKLASPLLPPLVAPLPVNRAAWIEKTFKIFV